ncbi:MAG: MotA/TolQ/ExbB proton channel family protein [Magnetococcus sp. WYHC-3]
MSWLSWWGEADWVVRGVFALLAGLSMLSWSILLRKTWHFAVVMRQERAAARCLDLGQPLMAGSACHALAALAQRWGGLPREVRVDRMGQGTREVRLALESGMAVLASIGNSAPFIGLFGTVWGIMHALQGLQGQALSMDMVAGPVAEALVATAAGLFAAVPSVLGYNYLVRRLRLLMSLLESNALWLIDQPGREGHDAAPPLS